MLILEAVSDKNGFTYLKLPFKLYFKLRFLSKQESVKLFIF
jgi:hypothetical protein